MLPFPKFSSSIFSPKLSATIDVELSVSFPECGWKVLFGVQTYCENTYTVPSTVSLICDHYVMCLRVIQLQLTTSYWKPLYSCSFPGSSFLVCIKAIYCIFLDE